MEVNWDIGRIRNPRSQRLSNWSEVTLPVHSSNHDLAILFLDKELWESRERGGWEGSSFQTRVTMPPPSLLCP